MGTTLFLEYEDVLAREALFMTCRLTPDEREQLFDAFLSVCLWQPIYYLWRPNLADEDDNHVVELAVAGGGEVMVTHNIRDFAHAELRFPGLRILQPATLLQEDL